MTTGEKIKKLRNDKGLRAEDLADAVGIDRSTVYRYEKGDIEKLPISALEPLAKALGTTVAYLMGWEDEPQKSIFDIPGIGPPPKLVPKPRLGVIACGEPVLALEDGAEVDMIPAEINCDYTLLCKGDSMIGARINDGDIVYIRKQDDVDNGEIACVLIDDEATLKKVYKYPGMIQLIAANPAYAPMVYTAADAKEIRIMGKAVGFRSNL